MPSSRHFSTILWAWERSRKASVSVTSSSSVTGQSPALQWSATTVSRSVRKASVRKCLALRSTISLSRKEVRHRFSERDPDVFSHSIGVVEEDSTERSSRGGTPSSLGIVFGQGRLPRNPFFFVGNLQCLLEDLHFHGLSTQDPFQFPNAVLELLGLGGSHDRFVGLQGRHPPSLTSFRHRKRRLGAMPFCRATKDTLIPGRSVSSTIRIFPTPTIVVDAGRLPQFRQSLCR